MYVVKHQKVHWDVDLQQCALFGRTELLIEVGEQDLESLRLNCRQCKVTKVKVDGSKAAYSMEDDCLEVVSDGQRDAEEYREFLSQWQDQADRGELLITPKTPLEAGQTARIAVRFELRDPLGGVHFVVPRDGFYEDRPRHCFTTAGVCESRLFMPCVDTFAEASEGASERLEPQYPTWELAFTVAKGLVAVSVGALERQYALPDGRTIFHYRLSNHTGAHGIGFAVGPFEAYPDPKIEGTTHFCLPGLMNNLKHTVDPFPVAASYFEGLLGKGVPYDSYQQVFVDEATETLSSYAGLTVFSSSLMSSVREIDNSFTNIRPMAGRAVVMQHFFNSVGPKACDDVWILYGIVGYLTGLFISYTLGTNEHTHWVRTELDWLIPRDNHRLPLHTSKHSHVQEYCSEFVQRKAGVVMRMLERLIGKENLLDVFLKIVDGEHLKEKQADGAADVDEEDADELMYKAILVSSSQFRQMITDKSSATPKQIASFYNNWVDRPGAAHMRVSFEWSAKDNVMELSVLQHQNHHFLGPIVIGCQDVDTYWEKRIALQDHDDVIAIPVKARNTKKKKKSIKLSNDNVEQNVDLSDESLPNHPIMWVIVDPNMEWYAKIDVEMPEVLWTFQAKFERRAHCQVLAIRQLAKCQSKFVFNKLASIAAKTAKPVILEGSSNKQKTFQPFWRVRQEAYEALTRHLDDPAKCSQADMLIKHFRELYCFTKYDKPMIRVNDFIDFEKYFLQRAVVTAIGQLRTAKGTSSGGAFSLINNLITMNDNTDNPFEDSNYMGTLLTSFARTVDIGRKKIRKMEAQDKKTHRRRLTEVLDALARAIGMDKISPSYHFTVTQKALEAIASLVLSRTIPRQDDIFSEHALYGHCDPLRTVAVTQIAKMLAASAEGGANETERRRDIEFLLELAENDPSPHMRFEVLKALAEAAPFAKHKTDKTDSVTLLTWVVERVWTIMNAGTAFDARSRLRALEFFETILPPDAHTRPPDTTTVKLKDTTSSMVLKLPFKEKKEEPQPGASADSDSGLKLTVQTGPTYYMYTAADDETPGHIAHALDCPVADLISLNQHNFGKAFTKTAKLMEGTTVLVPHSAKKNVWEIPGQSTFGQPAEQADAVSQPKEGSSYRLWNKFPEIDSASLRDGEEWESTKGGAVTKVKSTWSGAQEWAIVRCNDDDVLKLPTLDGRKSRLAVVSNVVYIRSSPDTDVTKVQRGTPVATLWIPHGRSFPSLGELYQCQFDSVGSPIAIDQLVHEALSSEHCQVILQAPAVMAVICEARHYTKHTVRDGDGETTVEGPLGVSLVIPEGALKLGTTVQMEIVGDSAATHGSVSPVLRLFPEDLHLSHPITVCLPTAIVYDTRHENPWTLWTGKDNGPHHPVGKEDAVDVTHTDGRCTFSVKHFSVWYLRPLTLAKAVWRLGQSLMRHRLQLAYYHPSKYRGDHVQNDTICVVVSRPEYGESCKDLKTEAHGIGVPFGIGTHDIDHDVSSLRFVWTRDGAVRSTKEHRLPALSQCYPCNIAGDSLRIELVHDDSRCAPDAPPAGSDVIAEWNMKGNPDAGLRLPVVVFHSHSLESSGGILRSLLTEVEHLNKHHDAGAIGAALQGRVGHNCSNFDVLIDRLTELRARQKPNTTSQLASAASGLMMQFIGHGSDGELSFEGGAGRVNELARSIAACRPACVIFNACNTSKIASAVRDACAADGTDTTVCFWWDKVPTQACEKLSRRLWSDLSTQIKLETWNGSGASYHRTIGDVMKSFVGIFLDSYKCLLRAPRIGVFPPLDHLICTCCKRKVPGSDQWVAGSGDGPPAVAAVAVEADDGDEVDVERASGYGGWLRRDTSNGMDWVKVCWTTYFGGKPTAGPVVEPGEFRCTFSHDFTCHWGESPSRAYYFEAWHEVADSAKLVNLCIHVHYWKKYKPAPMECGKPKHINLRRAFPVDMSEIQKRVDGTTQDPIPPPEGMVKHDRPNWINAMSQFCHDPAKPAATEKTRAEAELRTFNHVQFCPVGNLWMEKEGVSICGGPTGYLRQNMDEPGWDFNKKPCEYPLRPAAEYKPLGFVPPRVPAADVAPVLVHAEKMRTADIAEEVGYGLSELALRGSVHVGLENDADMVGACAAQAQALADSSSVF
eukprot:m.113352 g.113352  ORF g.113352 m.113352 type:complete len:2116 (+) comp10798_c0_seq3:312-6659(+)